MFKNKSTIIKISSPTVDDSCIEARTCLSKDDNISFQRKGFVGFECQFKPDVWSLEGNASFSPDTTELLFLTKDNQTTSASIETILDNAGTIKFNYVNLIADVNATFTVYIDDQPTVLNLSESFAEIPITQGLHVIKLVYVNLDTKTSEYLLTISKWSITYDSCVNLTVPYSLLGYRYLNFYDSNVLSVPKSNSRFISAGISNYGLTTESFMNVAYLISEPISLKRIFAAFKNVKMNQCNNCIGTIKLQIYYSKCEDGKYSDPVASNLSLSIKISSNGSYCANEVGSLDLDVSDLIAIGVSSDDCICSFRLAVNIGSIDLSSNQVTVNSKSNSSIIACKGCIKNKLTK